jgi:type I restriction enzyme S subunit
MTPLPRGWSKKKLGEIADTQLGKMLNKSKQNDSRKVPYLRTDNVHWGRIDLSLVKEMEITPDERDKFIAKPGDLLVCEGGASGRTAIWNLDYEIGIQNHLHRVRTRGEVSNKYLMYYMEWLVKNGLINHLIKGVTISHLSQSSLRSIGICYPEINEQNQIVELLEDHLSRLDAALADVKQAKLKAAQFRKSLLQSIFEGQYSTSSDTWEHRTIGDFAEVKGGKRLPKGTKWSDEPTVHPYIRATDVKFGKINTEDLVHVPDSVWKSISRYVVEENDVVITIAGTIGEIAVVPSGLAGANLTENAAKLVFDHHYVMPSYLSMYLQSPSVQQEFKELSRATTQAKLALYRIATVEIPVPTLHEQQKIMELVDEKLTYLNSSLNQISAIELQASSLRRSLLQAAFTGQLTNEVVSV